MVILKLSMVEQDIVLEALNLYIDVDKGSEKSQLAYFLHDRLNNLTIVDDAEPI